MDDVEPTPETPSDDDDLIEVAWTKKERTSSSQPATLEIDDLAEIKRQLEEEKTRSGEMRDKWQRAAADLSNLRKRVEQEKEDRDKMAGMLFVQELLPVLDNFQRALDTIPGNLRMLTWVYGVALIERELQATLERRGVTPIETADQPFSPHFHEAVSERETEDVEPGHIVQEYQRGYVMHGYVIRPALVEVAKAPVAEASPEAQPDTPEDAVDEPAQETANE
jgi:molecular chaperone GrpE